MKRLSLYLFLLLFTLQTPSWTDDIRDFQIEGMSLGDSALDYFTKEELNNALDITYYKNNTFMYYFLDVPNSQTYESIQITVKPDDKKYIIYNLDGHIFYYKNIKNCYKKMDEVKKDIDSVFTVKSKSDTANHPIDETGNSKYSRIAYRFPSGDIAEIICYDMSKKLEGKGKYDRFAITLGLKEFRSFLTNVQYK